MTEITETAQVRPEEMLINAIAEMLAGLSHVAVGASSRFRQGYAQVFASEDDCES